MFISQIFFNVFLHTKFCETGYYQKNKNKNKSEVLYFLITFKIAIRLQFLLKLQNAVDFYGSGKGKIN